MTHEEIIKRMNYVKSKRQITLQEIADKSGYSMWTVGRLLKGENTGMNALFDVIEVLGLEVNVI